MFTRMKNFFISAIRWVKSFFVSEEKEMDEYAKNREIAMQKEPVTTKVILAGNSLDTAKTVEAFEEGLKTCGADMDKKAALDCFYAVSFLVPFAGRGSLGLVKTLSAEAKDLLIIACNLIDGDYVGKYRYGGIKDSSRYAKRIAETIEACK